MGYLLVKVGEEERPASPDDLADVIKQFTKLKADPSLTLVTHHAIDFQYIDPPLGHTVVYRVGDVRRPATEDDIRSLQAEITDAKEEDRPVVFHHNIRVEYVKI